MSKQLENLNAVRTPMSEAGNSENTNETAAVTPAEPEANRPVRTAEPERESRSGGSTTRFKHTQLGNAERLVAQHGSDLRHCHSWKKWLVWDRKRWKVDETGEIERRAINTIRSIYENAANIGDEEIGEKMKTHARRSETKRGIDDMIAIAQNLPGIPVSPMELDADPMLLNCVNGTIDLRTGRLEPPRRENLITKMVPIEFDAGAGCPVFKQFLGRILGGDKELIAYMQKVVGYALTGQVVEKALFLLHGGGNNGKTTLLETVRALLGDYAGVAEIDLLMQNGRDDIRDRAVAQLVGLRFVTASEAQEGQRLNEAKVKNLTGMGRLQARHIYGRHFEFDPQFKLFVDANHKPAIGGTDNAIWSRIHMVPFGVSIPKEQQDRDLGKKLRAELPGILAWAVRGCLKWQQDGLQPPRAVTDAVGQYRNEMDVVAEFIADSCLLEPAATVPAADLHNAYKRWSDARRGDEPFSETKFGTRLSEMGYQPSRTKGIRVRKGLRLRTEPVVAITSRPGQEREMVFPAA